MIAGLKQIWSWIYPIVIGVLVALVIRQWVMTINLVPTGSMEPTIPAPCRVFVNKLAIEFGQPYRGEVVTFHWPDNPSEVFVKRIIGLPGDTVTVTNNAVYVNGKKYTVPDIVQPNFRGFGTYHVPAGHYFMMGDNRPVSDDSRLWTHKYVARSAIIGKAEFVVFPFDKIKSISN